MSQGSYPQAPRMFAIEQQELPVVVLEVEGRLPLLVRKGPVDARLGQRSLRTSFYALLLIDENGLRHLVREGVEENGGTMGQIGVALDGKGDLVGRRLVPDEADDLLGIRVIDGYKSYFP